MASSSSSTAFRTFDLANDIQELSPDDELFRYDEKADKAFGNQAPWKNKYVYKLYAQACNVLSDTALTTLRRARSRQLLS